MSIKTTLKKNLPSVIINIYSSIRRNFRHSKYLKQKRYKNWLKSGKPLPPPHIVKQRTVEEYARRCNLSKLIETGTFMGDMVFTQKNKFKKIISIELQPVFYTEAKLLFKKYNNIEILQGDSSDVLKLLAKKNEFSAPCLFWLDGHYSEGNTAKGEKETPIMEELNAILDTKQNHILLIDDARCFIGENDYPTIDQLKTFVTNIFPKSNFTVADDIIRIEIIVS